MKNNFPTLETLVLSENIITDISEICKFTNLKILDLSLNQITKIENCNFPNLKILNLSSNNITTIENCDFPVLEELILSDNQLIDISKIIFKNLTHLDLSRNKISKECLKYLTNLSNLEENLAGWYRFRRKVHTFSHTLPENIVTGQTWNEQ